MTSRFEEDSDTSGNESSNESDETSSGQSSVKSFEFVDIEAVESDGDDDGGDQDYVIVDSVIDDKEEEEDDDDTNMNGFIADDADSDDGNENNSELNHMQIRNRLNKELEEKESELLYDTETANNAQKQHLLQQLTKPKENTQKQSERYYDLLANDKNIIVDDDVSSESAAEDDSSAHIDSSDENSDNEMSGESESESESDDNDEAETKNGLSELSKLQFEKLLSHTMVNLALKLEENDNKNMSQQINPFITMDDQISLEVNNELDMSQLLSFISDDDENYNNANNDMEDADIEKINNPKDFETIIPFEKSHNILPGPSTSSSNHPSNLRKSKLNTTTLSSNNDENTFIREEIRLAENTMKRAITNKVNMEKKNFAPPLSSLDRRGKRNRPRRENAGQEWFNMSAGKLTPANKLHFLMLKYRHMLYRDYKPPKLKGDFMPKFFQMGTIIEGPTEFYSSRMTRRQRRSSWANQYLGDPSTKQWLEEKTMRAQNRIRKPGKRFWAPMRKLNVNSRYKLRKRLQANRRRRSWKKKK